MRSPWQRFYAWAHCRRRRRWAPRAKGLGRPCVSVGNLHWGGSGKTPTVIALARGLTARGLRVAVLSRGYRRRGSGSLLVSAGDGPPAGGPAADGPLAGGPAGGTPLADGPLATVEEAGDEPFLIAETVPDAIVAVGADRLASAAMALRDDPAIDVFLLDDGFSHLKARRDVEILTFPHLDPFAGARLLPSGRLREPLGMVRLAAAAVLTGLPAGEAPPPDFEPTLRRHGFEGEVFTSSLRAEVVPAVHDESGAPVSPPAARRAGEGLGDARPGAETANAGARKLPARPLLVTGVARPERVARTAAAAGLEPVGHLRFPDHHAYPPGSLGKIAAASARHRSDALAVTSKDAVKLRGRLPEGFPPLLELRVEADFTPDLVAWLAVRLGV